MPENTSSPGALRAARKAFEAAFAWSEKPYTPGCIEDGLAATAAMIEEETGLRELLEAVAAVEVAIRDAGGEHVGTDVWLRLRAVIEAVSAGRLPADAPALADETPSCRRR